MTSAGFQWALSVASILAVWLIGFKRWWSQAFSLALNAIWALYFFRTDQGAFVPMQLLYVLVNAWNLRRWWLDDHKRA
jgi:hypothetical protein